MIERWRQTAKQLLPLKEKDREAMVEEWRAEMIRSGEAQNNVNFIPVIGDWHKRVERAKLLGMLAEKQKR